MLDFAAVPCSWIPYIQTRILLPRDILEFLPLKKINLSLCDLRFVNKRFFSSSVSCKDLFRNTLHSRFGGFERYLVARHG